MDILELKRNLGNGLIKKVIDHLIKTVDEENLNDIISINARFSTIEIQNSRGVIGMQDYMLERNKITQSLLGLIDSIQESSSKKSENTDETQNWKIQWIKERYPESFIKEDNELPEMREFENSKLEYRVILPEKFAIRERLPYTGEVGVNFTNYYDKENIKMSIALGINLILLGDMKLFILAIIFPKVSSDHVHDQYSQIKSLASSFYNWKKVETWFKFEIIEQEK